MKFPAKCKPEACAAKEETLYVGYAINGVGVIVENGVTYLAATDGRCATMIRAEAEETDKGCADSIYPAAAFAAARKAAGNKAQECQLALNGTARVAAGGVTTEYAKVEGRFPDVLACTPKGKPIATVAIHADLLAKIQAGFGSDGVLLELFGERMPLKVHPVTIGTRYTEDKSGTFGILMPVAAG